MGNRYRRLCILEYRLRGGFAVAAASDEAVDAGDERLDVHREASLAFQQVLLRFEELAVAAPGLALRSVGGRRKLAESFDDRMEHLLSFEVLLADTSVELDATSTTQTTPI